MKLRSILAVTLMACVTGSAIAQVEPPAVPQMLPGQYVIHYTLVRIGGLIPGSGKPASTDRHGEDSRCWTAEGQGLPPFMGSRFSRCRIVRGSVEGTHASGTARCQDANTYGSFNYDGEFQPASAHVTLDTELRFKNRPGPTTALFEVTLTRTAETCNPTAPAAAGVRAAAAAAASEAAAAASEAARDAMKKM
jgi:hypothetical protein